MVRVNCVKCVASKLCGVEHKLRPAVTVSHTITNSSYRFVSSKNIITFKYMLTFTDDFNRSTIVYLLNTKGEVERYIRKYMHGDGTNKFYKKSKKIKI